MRPASILSNQIITDHPDEQSTIWWFDPAGDITDGWDLAGKNPEGEISANLSGQEALCDPENDEITIVIDSTGNPNNSDDLNFTPLLWAIKSMRASSWINSQL